MGVDTCHCSWDPLSHSFFPLPPHPSSLPRHTMFLVPFLSPPSPHDSLPTILWVVGYVGHLKPFNSFQVLRTCLFHPYISRRKATRNYLKTLKASQYDSLDTAFFLHFPRASNPNSFGVIAAPCFCLVLCSMGL